MAEPTPRRRARLLVFVHIPKTAGTTLRTVLSFNEPGPRSRALGNVFKGGGGISKGLIERLRADRGPDLRGVGLVRGHFPLGIRDYLPKYVPKDRELRCFTFLREPAERTLSHYFRIRESGRGYGLPPLAPNATLDETLEGGYIHDNVQTRMLSGLAEPFGEVDDEMLEQAKRNLAEELVFFGLTERFDESLVLAKHRLGFRSILYRSSGRVNRQRPRGDEIPPDLRRAAERCNRYDIELYGYAQELFDNAPERQELEFQVELAALQAAKANGGIVVEGPPPPQWGGDEEAWRMFLDARAKVLRLEFDVARHNTPRVKARPRATAASGTVSQASAPVAPAKRLVRAMTGRQQATGAKAEETETVESVEPDSRRSAESPPKREAKRGSKPRTRAKRSRDSGGSTPAGARAASVSEARNPRRKKPHNQRPRSDRG